MAQDPVLKLRLMNVYGELLAEQVDVLFQNLTRASDRRRVRVTAARTLNIGGLSGAPNGFYRMTVDPPSYRPVGSLISLKASGATSEDLYFPIDISKVTGLGKPAFNKLPQDSQDLLARSARVALFEGKSGSVLYGAIGDERSAGFLNIMAKCRVTPLANGRIAASYLDELIELRQDRFFALAPKEFREETKNSVGPHFFDPAGDALHHPPAGYTHAGSFKTHDHYGNLQLTFFMRDGDPQCLVDIDIDDASGIEHVFQVLRNEISGNPTHPYNIHEILVRHQLLDPGYRLVVA